MDVYTDSKSCLLTRPGYYLKLVDTGTNTILEFHEKDRLYTIKGFH